MAKCEVRAITRVASGIVMMLVLAGCSGAYLRASGVARAPVAPYPPSRELTGIEWDLAPMPAQRRAIGSDLWPCAWARDGNLYCAWGDGGGFDGNSDFDGRVSLGVARIGGIPDRDDPTRWSGKNVWGAPPFAESRAWFGGKAASMAAVNGALYASASLWTSANTADPVAKGGQGPLNTLIWSDDLGVTWQIAPWRTELEPGAFLDFGRDSEAAFDGFVYVYYMRAGDSRHIFLKRVARELIREDPSTAGSYQFFSEGRGGGRDAHWAAREADARPVFRGRANVTLPSVVYDRALGRYLLVTGHFESPAAEDASLGRFGVFESVHPWGPWATVAYYEDWGGLASHSRGDFLGLHIPSKWISADGRTFWAVFSGLNEFDSFNIVHATIVTRGRH